MRQKRPVAVGIILILLGLWSLLSALGLDWVRMDRLWPLIPMIGGLFSIYSALARERRDSDGVWFGVTALLCGALFLYITVGQGEWGDLSWLWPAFPLAAGIGWMASWFVDLRQVSNLVAGVIALVVASVGFLYTYGTLDSEAGKAALAWWPLILIVLGVGFVIQFLVQRR